MAFRTHIVPTFGGGLRFNTHPAYLEDHEWSWSNAMEPIDGWAQTRVVMAAVALGANYVPASNNPIGLVPDLIDLSATKSFLVPTRHSVTKAVRLFQITAGAGSVTEKTASGTAATGESAANSKPYMLPVVVNGLQVLCFGLGGNHSVATYDGTNHTRVAPSGFTIQGRVLCAASNYAILTMTSAGTASGLRQVRVSNATDATTWDPGISNSADEFTTDAHADIRGLVTGPDGAVLFSGDRVQVMQSTGGIPPFTLRIISDAGMAGGFQLAASTPYGVMYWTGRELVGLTGGAVPGSDKVARYVMNLTSSQFPTVGKLLWNPQDNALITPTDTERMYFNPRTQAWWRIAWEATPYDHAIGITPVGTPALYAMVTSAGSLYTEAVTTNAASTFVDTKDFNFGDPVQAVEINRIKVDWEPLTNASTDALQIYGWAHDDLSPTLLGAYGGNADRTAQFTSLGTLTAGTSELPIRPTVAKYHRFRFSRSSGSFRIRGFSLSYQPRGRA